jgi:tRNA wybutosine-synthesizing protein 4
VDYEILLETKREIIFNHHEMRDLLHSRVTDPAGNGNPILLDSQEYAAIGCDLRNLKRLDRLLQMAVEDLEECIVLCIAEDSTSYMKLEAANGLISWSSGLSTGNPTQCWRWKFA